MYISELEQLLEVKRGEIFALEKELDLDPIECKMGSVLTFKFDELDDEKIINYFKAKAKAEEVKKAEARALKEKEIKERINELKKQYPLVTDERCFRTQWWPDIVPDCFKDLEDENRD